MEVKRIVVVGAGFMGAGIAQVCAQAGYDVMLNDVTIEAIERGINIVSKNLDGQVKKEKISADARDAIMARMSRAERLEDAKQADFIIEAVFENYDVKKEVFQKLDAICKPEAIFATNTSSIPISKLAATANRPDKFIGMHFFSPVPVMQLVEIIRGLKTSLDTIKTTEEVVIKMKKEGVRVKDVPGFLVNRINNALRNEAYNCLMEGVASVQDIDKALKLGLRHPMGAFELADFVGLDVSLNVARSLFDGYKDIKWRPNMIVEQLVLSGDLGRKTGKGWYDYTSGEMKPRTDIDFK